MTVAQRWAWRIGAIVAIAAVVHMAAVWAVPRLIMHRVLNTSPAELGARTAEQAAQTVYFPPMTDASQRRIVLPSPDLLYAVCRFDLSHAPLRVRADPKLPGYWSVALYASNSDNFLVVNDRELAGRPLDLVVVGPGATAASAPPGTRVVVAPSTRGLVLMRVLVADYAAEQATLEPARRTLRCDALAP